MEEYYSKGEERFGLISSRLYAIFTGFSEMRDFYSFVVRDLVLSGAGSILDIGTGTGEIMRGIALKNKGIGLYAIDPSRDMLHIARRKSRGLGVHFALGSGRHIPFSRKFDLVFSSLSFHHWKEKEVSLSAIRHVLSEKGEIRIYEVDKSRMGLISKFMVGSHSISVDEVRKVLPDNLEVCRHASFSKFVVITIKRHC